MTPGLWFLAGMVTTLIGVCGLAVVAAQILAISSEQRCDPDQMDVEVRLREGAGRQ